MNKEWFLNYPRRRDEPDFADFLVSFPTFDFFDFSIVVRSDSGRQAHCPCSHAKDIFRLSFIKVVYHTFTVLKWMWWRELISNTTSSAFFNLFKHDSCNVIATSKTFLCKTLICFMWLNLWFSWKLKAVLKLLFNHYRMHYPIFDRNWGIRIFHIVLLHKWRCLALQYRQHQILYHSDYHPKRLDSGRFFLISHHI